jgi:hypothetical protein
LLPTVDTVRCSALVSDRRTWLADESRMREVVGTNCASPTKRSSFSSTPIAPEKLDPTDRSSSPSSSSLALETMVLWLVVGGSSTTFDIAMSEK